MQIVIVLKIEVPLNAFTFLDAFQCTPFSTYILFSSDTLQLIEMRNFGTDEVANGVPHESDDKQPRTFKAQRDVVPIVKVRLESGCRTPIDGYGT